RPILKVIMVHGVGTHVPGYSARMSANLARSLGLSVVAPEAKAFPIEAPAFAGETLGTLTVTRHTNVARDREMLFFELTWSPISQPAKDAIAFDSTAVYAHRRASLNNLFKHFVNDVAPDPLVYTGTGRDRIQTTIGQALCWALSADWQGLPDAQQPCTPAPPACAPRLGVHAFASLPPSPLVYRGTGRDRSQTTIGQALCWALSADWQGLPDAQQLCTPDHPAFASRLDVDEFAFITHSLGSRITTDGLTRLTRVIEMAGMDRPEVRRVSQSLQGRDVKIFMLANQLPLLQSGLEPASVVGAVPAYCRPEGADFADRAFEQTELI